MDECSLNKGRVSDYFLLGFFRRSLKTGRLSAQVTVGARCQMINGGLLSIAELPPFSF